MTYPVIMHGSEDSLDDDAYIVIPEPIDGKTAKALCKDYLPLNANLIVITDGFVSWSYKGTEDECNNSILHTFHLHEQTIEQPIKKEIKRKIGLKMLRTIRGLLTYCSRTELRKEIKKALKSEDIHYKISVLKTIDLTEIKDFQKNSLIEVYKFFAFQLGSTLALMEKNEQLYTKSSVRNAFPDMTKALNREESDPSVLQSYLIKFIEACENNIKDIYKHKELIRTDFFDNKEIISVKKEIVLPPVVVFDLDQTLYYEGDRAKFRKKETLDLDTYFSLCLEDKPIQSIINILIDYYERGYEIWIVSGRYEPLAMKDTLEALKRDNIPFHNIKLRGEDNFLPDYVLKPAWMAKYIGLDRIEAVYDDQDRVIEGFRKKGLTVYDVKLLY